MNHHYSTIKKGKKFKKIKELFTKEEYHYLTKTLKKVIDTNYEEINSSINWTEEELEKLKIVKARREKEIHYNRFKN